MSSRKAEVPAPEILHQFSESLGAAIDAKDSFTSLHSEEVAEISHSLALTMGLDAGAADIIHVAGHLHDIGKIGIPDEILRKEEPLTDLDWKFIRRHPDIGADILRPVDALARAGIVDMVRHHHERFDGQGYPHGLKGNAIPPGARIISLADSLSAILQNRPYRPAGDFETAVAEIINCSGTQFDPEVVKGFLKIKDEIRSILHFLNPDKLDVA